MSAAREAAVATLILAATALGIAALGIASIASSADDNQWTPDGRRCVINIHAHRQWLWVDDYTTVKRYCEVNR